MKFWLDGLLVYFPYTFIYPEQYAYMLSLKHSLDVKGPCLLEMPSGTGKTVALLSLITSYQLRYPSRKLIYCSRTVGEIEKAVEELRRVVAYREGQMEAGDGGAPSFLGLALSSRRNLCIHPSVREETEAPVVDGLCRSMTASWVRKAARDASPEDAESSRKRKRSPHQQDVADIEDVVMEEPGDGDDDGLCRWYEKFQEDGADALLNGVYSLEDLREFGRAQGWCPYFLARRLIHHASVVIFSYQYLIDPKISDMVSKDFSGDSIVVFDEAHNIDDVCINALSVNIDRTTLEKSSESLSRLKSAILSLKASDEAKLQEEYSRLVDGMAQTGIARVAAADQHHSDPVLPEDVMQEAVPGSIRKGQHFVGFLRRLVEYLKGRLRTHRVQSESPEMFLFRCTQEVMIEPRQLRFAASRLSSLLFTLEITNVGEYLPLSYVCDFATLVATYSSGFVLIIEPFDSAGRSLFEPRMQFCCLDASIAMRPILGKFKSVVITSGTLSPLDMYPRMLSFRPVISKRFPMTLNRSCVCPLIISRGSDQVAVSTKFEVRNDPSVVRNFGNILIETAARVPDGVVCFMPSYRYLEDTVAMWSEMGLLNEVLKHKLVFIETKDPVESSLALNNYRLACESGRGGVLLSVARGKISEGIDFDHHFGRAVILFGIPYINTQSRVLRARLEFLRDEYDIKEAEFLTFDAMRTASQCMGRVIRGKTDYGVMLLADKRYNRSDKRTKLPQWIAEYLQRSHLNLSTDMALNLVTKFQKEVAQPYSLEEALGKSLWTEEMVLQQPASAPPRHH